WWLWERTPVCNKRTIRILIKYGFTFFVVVESKTSIDFNTIRYKKILIILSFKLVKPFNWNPAILVVFYSIDSDSRNILPRSIGAIKNEYQSEQLKCRNNTL